LHDLALALVERGAVQHGAGGEPTQVAAHHMWFRERWLQVESACRDSADSLDQHLGRRVLEDVARYSYYRLISGRYCAPVIGL